MKFSRTLALTVMLLTIGCGRHDTDGERVEFSRSMAKYFDVSQCWVKEERSSGWSSFKGAIAFYRVDGVFYPVVFSGFCDPPSNVVTELGDGTLEIATAGIQGSRRNVRSVNVFDHRPVRELSTAQRADVGLSPQWPVAIYAISGAIKIDRTKPLKSYAIKTIDIQAAQAIPKEMFGVFLQHPGRRAQLVDYYLTGNGLDVEGYKSPLL